MPWVRGDWRPTEGEARAAITSSYYGDEFTDRENELDTLVDAVRRDWAAQLREKAETVPQDERAGLLRAADLLNPDTPDET